MRLGVLFSGGKDSAYAMYKAMGEHEIVCLISVVSKNEDSYMFHTPNVSITTLQAEAMGLPLVQEATEGRKEEELDDLRRAVERAVREYGIEGVVTGALASTYQKERIQRICDGLGLKCLNPLWGMNQVRLLEEVVAAGFRVIVAGVFAYPLDERWLGREIDEDMIKELAALGRKFKINPAGEGGEIETTVLDAPFFRKRIQVLDSEAKAKNNAGVYSIKTAKLVDK